MKIRRCFDGHRLDAGLDQPFVTGEAAEAARGLHAKGITRRLGAILKIIRHRIDLEPTMLSEQVRNPFATPALPDYAELDLRLVGGRRGWVRSLGSNRAPYRRGGGGGQGGAEKVPAGIVFWFIFSIHNCG